MNARTGFRRSALLWTVLALLASSALLWWALQAKDKSAPPAAAQRPALTISSVLPARTSLPRQLSANGDIAAWQEASVGTESNGLKLDTVLVNVGDVVRRGQVLARFDPRSVQADLAQGRASLQEARATAAQAEGNAARARNLSASGALSRQEVDQYATAQQTAQARVAVASAVLEAQQLRLAQAVVLAPDDGVISERKATVGAVVATGTELFRLIRQGRLEWRAEVLASDLPLLAPGTRARVTAASGAVVDGTVRKAGPTVNPETRKLLVYVDIPAMARAPATVNSQVTGQASGLPTVLPGMFARGEFGLGESDALTVPQEAVVVRDGFSYVFVVDASQHVQLRKVQVGRRVGAQVEVLGGLDAQQPVAVQGAGFLNDGDLVSVVPRTANLELKQAPALASQAPAAIK